MLVVMATIGISSCQQEEKSAGDKFYAKKQYNKAIEAYTEHIKLQPTHIKSIYNRGRSFEEIGQYGKAANDFLLVIDIDAKNTNAMLSMAELKYREKNYDKARYYAEQTVKINDGLASAHFWLGRSYHQLGEFGDALKSYNSALSLDASLGQAYLNRGAIHMTNGKKASGCEDFRKALSLSVKGASQAVKKYCK